MRSWQSLVLLALLLSAAGASSARADGAAVDANFSCKYPGYYADTLKVLWKPLATLPALVRPGDTLTVWANAPSSPTNWSATLRFGALSFAMSPAGGSYQANLNKWVLGFLVPVGLPEELYDLILSSDSGVLDTTRHSVKVLPAFRGDYYFAQVTDTHLPEHTTSSSSGFSTCDTSGMADFDAVIADLNVIHPEFILHTGDLTNEGDLDTLYQMNEMSRALQMVYQLRDPFFLVTGNHDVGGWTATPVPAGTSRRDWWRFFGWSYLLSPPPGDPYHSQDYFFDYDSLRVIALESYLNYDSWMSGIWGAGSFTAEQISWLNQQVAAAGPRHKLLMYHFDFDQGANTGSTSGPWQLNIPSLGVDGSIWGHYHTVPENSVTSHTAHPFNLGCQAVCDGNRTFRIFRVHNGNISPGIMHHAGTTTDSLTTAWSGPNDGTQSQLSVTVTNRFGEAWDHARLVFFMADHDSNYAATGGTVAQTIRQGGMINVYVDCVLPASGSANVSVVPTTPIVGVGSAPPAAFRLSRPSSNPFRPGTAALRLTYSMPVAGEATLAVYDLGGRRVATVFRGHLGPGEHASSWNGRNDAGQPLAAGVYVARLRTASGERSQKLVLVR